ncbi:TPA: hypothetical protein NO423_004092 [Salmonella enterica subsp. enterica serovar Infantis]|nr:hypothetical protein [Salmonella enterica subsp. enterica serovar Infantis]HCI4149828.1 hypothetical protein [Salmonella enterica subsp. enterica serovar Infantis]
MNYETRTTDKLNEHEHIIVLGKTRYEAGRQYPWYGQHGLVGSYFATQSEAVRFAREGDKE